jgi:hypothetical protein
MLWLIMNESIRLQEAFKGVKGATAGIEILDSLSSYFNEKTVFACKRADLNSAV